MTRLYNTLEDRNTVGNQLEINDTEPSATEGLGTALEQPDEQVTTIVIINDHPNDTGCFGVCWGVIGAIESMKRTMDLMASTLCGNAGRTR